MKEADYLKELVEAKVLPAKTKVTDHTHAEFKKMYDDHRAQEGNEQLKTEDGLGQAKIDLSQKESDLTEREEALNLREYAIKEKEDALENSEEQGPREIMNNEEAANKGLQLFGTDVNKWRVLCKAVGKTFMASTKALDLPGHSILVESVREIYNDEREIVCCTSSLTTVSGRLVESEEKDIWKIV